MTQEDKSIFWWKGGLSKTQYEEWKKCIKDREKLYNNIITTELFMLLFLVYGTIQMGSIYLFIMSIMTIFNVFYLNSNSHNLAVKYADKQFNLKDREDETI